MAVLPRGGYESLTQALLTMSERARELTGDEDDQEGARQRGGHTVFQEEGTARAEAWWPQRAKHV